MHITHQSTHSASCRLSTLGYGDRLYGNPGTVDTPAPTGAPVELIKLEVNITSESSFADNSTVNSTREGLIIAADGTFSEFITTVECEGGNETDIREAMSCSCSAQVKDQAGQPKNCTCSVCASGFGLNPISIQCQDDFLVAECSSMDCDFTCNGTCISDCENSDEKCEVCAAPPSPPFGLADLLPKCALNATLNEIAPCLEDYSDPECFTTAILANIQLCLIAEWSGPGPDLGEPVDLQFINETAVCFEPLGDCIVGKVVDAFAEIPPCILGSGLALAQCFIDNPNCALPCAAANWTSPFDTVNDTDLTSCSNVTSDIMEPMCELVSCCTPCIEELEDLAACAVNQSSSLSDCELKCAPASESRRLDGITDIVTTASATVTFSRCISTILDSENVTVWFDLVDCVIGEILDVYDQLTVTVAPTIAPSTTSPTSMPTGAPSTLTPTLAPSPAAQEYTFTGLTMRLQGGKQLTPASRTAFEEATEEL